MAHLVEAATGQVVIIGNIITIQHALPSIDSQAVWPHESLVLLGKVACLKWVPLMDMGLRVVGLAVVAGSHRRELSIILEYLWEEAARSLGHRQPVVALENVADNSQMTN